MSNYTKSTNFAAKDALVTGNPSKAVKGTEIDNELNAIAAAIATKVDSVVGQLQLGNGTGSVPSYSFATSSSTGMYSPAANQLAFVAAGAQALTITSAQVTFYIGGTLAGYFDNSLNLNLANALAIGNGGTGALTAAGARTNLGVTATGLDTNYCGRANNLVDLANVVTARTNLGLGSIAVLNTIAPANVSGGVLKQASLTSGVVTVQSGGSPSGGSDGDIFLIY